VCSQEEQLLPDRIGSGNSMELCQGRGSGGLGTGAAPEGGGHGTGCPGLRVQPRVLEFKEHLDNALKHRV